MNFPKHHTLLKSAHFSMHSGSHGQLMHQISVANGGSYNDPALIHQRSCAQAWHTLQSPTIELRGGDFDWDNWAGLPPAALAEQRAATAALLEAPESPIRQLLHGLQKLLTAPEHDSKGAAADHNRCAIGTCQCFLVTAIVM